jgi:hypothetical protein
MKHYMDVISEASPSHCVHVQRERERGARERERERARAHVRERESERARETCIDTNTAAMHMYEQGLYMRVHVNVLYSGNSLTPLPQTYMYVYSTCNYM